MGKGQIAEVRKPVSNTKENVVAPTPAPTSAPTLASVQKPAAEPTPNAPSATTSKAPIKPINEAPQPVSDGDSSANQNGLTNGNNKRYPKQKWVPLEIDLSKSRNKRDRTPRTTRRPAPPSSKNGDSAANEDEEYYSDRPPRPRRFRPSTTAYRGAKSSTISRGGRRPGTKSSARRSEYSDYPTEFSHAAKARSLDAPPFMMPYMGTFYYNGVPSYANMDTLSMKDAIKKQM